MHVAVYTPNRDGLDRDVAHSAVLETALFKIGKRKREGAVNILHLSRHIYHNATCVQMLLKQWRAR